MQAKGFQSLSGKPMGPMQFVLLTFFPLSAQKFIVRGVQSITLKSSPSQLLPVHFNFMCINVLLLLKKKHKNNPLYILKVSVAYYRQQNNEIKHVDIGRFSSCPCIGKPSEMMTFKTELMIICRWIQYLSFSECNYLCIAVFPNYNYGDQRNILQLVESS